MDFTELLFPEIVDKILSYLPAKDLSSVSRCCIKWREITNKDPFWLHFCMVNGWLKYGLNTDLIHEKSLNVKMTNVGGNSPVFQLYVPEGTRLSPVCKWKNIFIRVHHLNKNWSRGRYSVAPLLRGHKEKVTALECNGQFIVSGSEDKSLRLWEITTGECLRKLDGHMDTITCILWKTYVEVFKGSIKHLYITSADCLGSVFPLAAMLRGFSLAAVHHAGGNTIITGCADAGIRVIDSTTFTILFSLQGHSASVDHLALVGKVLVSASSDRSVRCWYLPDRRMIQIMRGHDDDVECMCGNGSYVVTGSWDKSLILWDIQKGEPVHQYEGHTEAVTCCHYDGEKIISGSGDNTVRIWTVNPPKCQSVMTGHTAEVYCLAANKDVIASGSADSTVRLWNHRGKSLFVLQGHLGVVRCLHINDERLVSGGDQKKVMVWDYKTGKLLNVLHRHPSLLHLMWVSDTKLITASPERPGTIAVLSYW